MKITQINWPQRLLLDGGGAATIYRVAPGLVAKVGAVDPTEVAAQRHFAGQDKALPVLDYQEALILPADVSKEACPVHGVRKEILPQGYDCTCGESQAVLLKPEADADSEIEKAELEKFQAEFSQLCWEQLGRQWDDRPRNVARYQGRLVALDFGEQ